MQIAELIVNESYWDLFTDNNFNVSSFLVPEVQSIIDKKLSSKEYIRNLFLLMQEKDLNIGTKYAVETLPDGRSRPGRIPAVRVNDATQTIWKVARNLKAVEKSISDLEENIYFLTESRTDKNKALPHKVLICNFEETKDSGYGVYNNFVRRIVNESGIIWISSEYLWNIWSDPKLELLYDFDMLFQERAKIYTKYSLNNDFDN